MTLTPEQIHLVEDNMGLVGQVLKNCVTVPKGSVITLEDLEQIGRIGLCKAAYAYEQRNALFSTYAYIVIRNEIFKELSKQWRRTKHEDDWIEDTEGVYQDRLSNIEELVSILRKESESMPQSSAKGVNALILLAEGYTCKEIAAIYGCTPNLVTAWMSNARRTLKKCEALRDYCVG
ncbi:MAG: sigma-70 family RNA polymerase sigma factor [Rikenellaceae bacterium]